MAGLAVGRIVYNNIELAADQEMMASHTMFKVSSSLLRKTVPKAIFGCTMDILASSK